MRGSRGRYEDKMTESVFVPGHHVKATNQGLPLLLVGRWSPAHSTKYVRRMTQHRPAPRQLLAQEPGLFLSIYFFSQQICKQVVSNRSWVKRRHT